ncbi:Putative acyl--CoA ligase YdaB [Geodia barretti]|uniref:Acyl--CoA ligase YdaB n=1 Tax=Geodia barretti TaxID=519541 RepID=A0AA35RTM0_GEOBA|nr:Putative acyl--CoA ligase YdaB [Geodia barretti]
MIFDGREFTYAQISQRVNRLANAMAELGVTPGDRIATMQVNSHRSIELYFAAAQLDAVYVPINFRAKTDELHQMLRIAEPTCLLWRAVSGVCWGKRNLFGCPRTG